MGVYTRHIDAEQHVSGSGDLYDFVQLDDARLVFVVGDVAGKGGHDGPLIWTSADLTDLVLQV